MGNSEIRIQDGRTHFDVQKQVKKKKTITELREMRRNARPITWITAYSYPTATVAERADIDMILVGDSGGMVELGYKSTNPVTMDEMISMCKAVRRGAPKTFVVGDMPQGSYEISDEDAVTNALRFIKEGDCDAVKLEGGERVASRVKAIHNAGIIVVGHLGLTPQSAQSFGGYRVQGRTVDEVKQIRRDMRSLEDSGASIILIEATPSACGVYLSLAARPDTIVMGIGAGRGVHGQLAIFHDVVGFYPDFKPKFIKSFIPDVIGHFNDCVKMAENTRLVNDAVIPGFDGVLMLTTLAVREYGNQVRNKAFPSNEYIYSNNDANEESIMELCNQLPVALRL